MTYIYSEMSSFVNEFSVFQKEANSFAKMERKETSTHILIPREFETVDLGIGPLQKGGYREDRRIYGKHRRNGKM